MKIRSKKEAFINFWEAHTLPMSILRILDYLFMRSNISLLYENRYGIKCLNQLISSDLFEYRGSATVFNLSSEQLYIGSDGLNDQYTLLDTGILNSPHYDLVKCLNNNADLRRCSYIQRVRKGILDFRMPHKISERYLTVLRQKYEEKQTEILNNTYDPIKIIKVFDKYYIADGKHTAAMCALLEMPVRCRDCSMLAFDSFSWWVYDKMNKNKKRYKKHLFYFESMMEYYGKKGENTCSMKQLRK